MTHRSLIRILVPAALAVALLHAVPGAADVEAGRRAYEAGDHAAALAEWRADAARGDAAALLHLGRLFEKGEGVAADPYTAFVLYRVALAQGSRQAEQAGNRVANLLPGQDLARGLTDAKGLVASRRYVPSLPGVAVAAAAPKPAAPVPKAEPARAAVPAPPPTPAVPVGGDAKWEVRYACNQMLRWQDKGSGGVRDLALFQAEPEPGFFLVGGHAQSNYDRAEDCALTLRGGSNLLVPPAGWDRVWRDKGTGAQMDGSIWRARSPDADHVCLGDVGQTGKDQPTVAQYRCVHRCLVTARRPAAPLWTTENTGAESPLAVFRLPHAKTFVAVQGGQAPAEILDLDPNATCR